MLYSKSLRYLHFSHSFFFSFVLLWLGEFHYPIFLVTHWSFLLIHLVCCWTPYCIFQFSYCVLQLWDFYLVVSYISHLLKFSLCLFILLPSSVSFFMTITLILYPVYYLSPFHSHLFPEVLPCPFIWYIFLCFPILLNSLLISTQQMKHHLSQSWSSSLMYEIKLDTQLWFNSCLSVKHLCAPKQPIVFLIVPSTWGCAKTWQHPKGEDLSSYIQANWKPDP